MPRDRGFTLLEVLTVLAIGTMLLVTLQQAFYVATRNAERVHSVADSMTRDVLHDAWLRQVLAGAVAETVAGKPGFQGDADRISGRTMAALFDGGSGGFALELSSLESASGRRLTYRQEQRAVALGDWPAGSRFAFLDESGKMSDQWPPAGDPAAQPPLPSWFAIVTVDGQIEFVAALPRAALRLPDASPFGSMPR